VPNTVSASPQTTIAAPYRTPAWDANPKDTADWKTLISTLGDETAAATRDMQEKLGVIMEPTVIDGVKAFILTPKVIAPENQNRLLVNIHGGGYVYNPGVAGTEEPTSMLRMAVSESSQSITGCRPITRIPLGWTIA
jgi:epsilon-lactone hydrolase